MTQAYMFVSMSERLPPSVVIPVSEPVEPNAEEAAKVSKASGINKNIKRNKKRNLKRRGENRERPKNCVATIDIPPDWRPALDKVVVVMTAQYVDRFAKMEDKAEVRVRSFADGTVVAIRDEVPVVLIKASEKP